MKKAFSALFVLGLLVAMIPAGAGAALAKESSCATIKSGELTYSAGHYLAGDQLAVGYDVFGYNYQAHMFNGSYFNAYAGRPGTGYAPYEGDDEAYLDEYPAAEGHWAWDYRNVKLMMKWNDAWLANTDCNDDGTLDRHFGFPTYSGSSAWLTNHADYGDGMEFVKIVAPQEDAYVAGDVWYTADGTEIGPVIWGAFATIQEVFAGQGATYVSPFGPGFGKF
ncbi:MAG: hypothetical protein ABFS21_07680 [Actinomycetota bacterium]